MSTKYKESADVPTEVLADRLNDLVKIICGPEKDLSRHFSMRVPAELDYCADLVISESGQRLLRLESMLAEKETEIDRLSNICTELKPLVHGIANWERNNGTASCLFTTEEKTKILEIIMHWAIEHSMRRIDEELSGNPEGEK